MRGRRTYRAKVVPTKRRWRWRVDLEWSIGRDDPAGWRWWPDFHHTRYVIGSQRRAITKARALWAKADAEQHAKQARSERVVVIGSRA